MNKGMNERMKEWSKEGTRKGGEEGERRSCTNSIASTEIRPSRAAEINPWPAEPVHYGTESTEC